jgi:hypothetical protein
MHGWHGKSLYNFRRKTRREMILGRPRNKWVYNIKMNLQDFFFEDLGWIRLDWGRIQW